MSISLSYLEVKSMITANDKSESVWKGYCLYYHDLVTRHGIWINNGFAGLL